MKERLEHFSVAAFLLDRLPLEHHLELFDLLPEAAVTEWVRARSSWSRPDLAVAMTRRWRISRATAYRWLNAIEAADRAQGRRAAAV